MSSSRSSNAFDRFTRGSISKRVIEHSLDESDEIFSNKIQEAVSNRVLQNSGIVLLYSRHFEQYIARTTTCQTYSIDMLSCPKEVYDYMYVEVHFIVDNIMCMSFEEFIVLLRYLEWERCHVVPRVFVHTREMKVSKRSKRILYHVFYDKVSPTIRI